VSMGCWPCWAATAAAVAAATAQAQAWGRQEPHCLHAQRRARGARHSQRTTTKPIEADRQQTAKTHHFPLANHLCCAQPVCARLFIASSPTLAPGTCGAHRGCLARAARSLCSNLCMQPRALAQLSPA